MTKMAEEPSQSEAETPLREYICTASRVKILGVTDATGTLKYLVKLEDGRVALVKAKLMNEYHPQTVISYLVSRIKWTIPDENTDSSSDEKED